jgi:hypothetical protein
MAKRDAATVQSSCFRQAPYQTGGDIAARAVEAGDETSWTAPALKTIGIGRGFGRECRWCAGRGNDGHAAADQIAASPAAGVVIAPQRY